jgi:hypothetical protein
MVLTPRTCCWAGLETRGAETAVARTAAMADTKVRRWTAGDANWRANGLRRALEKVLELMLDGIGVGMGQEEKSSEVDGETAVLWFTVCDSDFFLQHLVELTPTSVAGRWGSSGGSLLRSSLVGQTICGGFKGLSWIAGASVRVAGLALRLHFGTRGMAGARPCLTNISLARSANTVYAFSPAHLGKTALFVYRVYRWAEME